MDRRSGGRRGRIGHFDQLTASDGGEFRQPCASSHCKIKTIPDWHASCIGSGVVPMLGPPGNQGVFQCSLLSLLPVKPPPHSPARSSLRSSSSRPPLRCRSPDNSKSRETRMNGRFLVNRRDAKVMGVAAGLADYTGVDPLIIRLGFVAATLIIGPVMILFYLLAAWLAPQQ